MKSMLPPYGGSKVTCGRLPPGVCWLFWKKSALRVIEFGSPRMDVYERSAWRRVVSLYRVDIMGGASLKRKSEAPPGGLPSSTSTRGCGQDEPLGRRRMKAPPLGWLRSRPVGIRILHRSQPAMGREAIGKRWSRPGDGCLNMRVEVEGPGPRKPNPTGATSG